MSTPFELHQKIRSVICEETGITATWSQHDRLLLPHEADRIEWRVRLILAEACAESVRRRMESYLHQGRRA